MAKRDTCPSASDLHAYDVLYVQQRSIFCLVTDRAIGHGHTVGYIPAAGAFLRKETGVRALLRLSSHFEGLDTSRILANCVESAVALELPAR